MNKASWEVAKTMNKLGRSLSLGAATCWLSLSAFGVENPYASIIERNTFGLKPVVAAPPVTAPSAPAPGVLLQGITTILGRPQVLLEIKLPASPPQPASEKTLVLDIGDREGEVEILEIDPGAGAVKMRVQGNVSVLNLKENSAKPAGGAVASAPTIKPSGPVVPPQGAVPSPTAAPAAPAGSTTVTPFGGTGVGNDNKPNLPSRTLRSQPAGFQGAAPTQQLPPELNPNDARSLPLEAQRALIEIERERTKAAVDAGKMPPIPPLNP